MLTTNQEGQEGVIQLGKDTDPQVQEDPHTVNALINYLYKFDYDSDYENNPFEVAGIVLDARMFLIANKVCYTLKSKWTAADTCSFYCSTSSSL